MAAQGIKRQVNLFSGECNYQIKIESEIPLEAGQRSISAKLFLRRGTVEGLLKKNEHPPAMHSAMDWCKHGYINQMVKLASHRFQGIAGRSNTEKTNIEHRTSNIEF